MARMTKKLIAEIKQVNESIYNKVKAESVNPDNYYTLLGMIQNAPHFENIDIMTFSGFMNTWEEKVNYLNMQLERLIKVYAL